MEQKHLELIQDLHARAKAGGLHVRYWSLKKDCLVVTIPADGEKDGQEAQATPAEDLPNNQAERQP